MSTKVLGPSIDIHGGGRDLIFPHHENETAQSEAAYEKPFVKYWIHNGFVNLNADKMSKSTGNFLTIREVLSQYPHEAIRYFLLSAHYRSPLDFSETNMKESLAALDRVYQTLQRLEEYRAPKKSAPVNAEEMMKALKEFPSEIQEAMDDDFNTAQVLGLTFETVRRINKFLDASPTAELAGQVSQLCRECFAILDRWLGLFGTPSQDYVENRKGFLLKSLGIQQAEVNLRIEERKTARQNKDFKRADEIRGELDGMGIFLKDSPDGSTSWGVK